jgi:choice-of-anchor C domain-containing protein
MRGDTVMKSAAFAAVVAVGVAFGAGSAGAVSIVNGSFETEGAATPPSGGFTTVTAIDATAIPGWIVTAGSIDYINGYWQAAAGTHSIDLNGLSAGTIAQTITGLTVGQTYQVSFALAGNPDGGPSTKTLGVTASISSTPYSFDTSIGPTTRSNMGWVTETFFFTAGHANELLSFVSSTFTGGGGVNDAAFGPAIDNVSITVRGEGPAPTPLPAALPLFAGGLGVIGLLRRRKRKAALAS